jgi:hypothetical protein
VYGIANFHGTDMPVDLSYRKAQKISSEKLDPAGAVTLNTSQLSRRAWKEFLQPPKAAHAYSLRLNDVSQAIHASTDSADLINEIESNLSNSNPQEIIFGPQNSKIVFLENKNLKSIQDDEFLKFETQEDLIYHMRFNEPLLF